MDCPVGSGRSCWTNLFGKADGWLLSTQHLFLRRKKSSFSINNELMESRNYTFRTPSYTRYGRRIHLCVSAIIFAVIHLKMCPHRFIAWKRWDMDGYEQADRMGFPFNWNGFDVFVSGNDNASIYTHSLSHSHSLSRSQVCVHLYSLISLFYDTAFARCRRTPFAKSTENWNKKNAVI